MSLWSDINGALRIHVRASIVGHPFTWLVTTLVIGFAAGVWLGLKFHSM
jgi:hypothetical protein